MIYTAILGVLLMLLPLFLLADYWAVKYAVTRRSSPWRQRVVWIVLAIGAAILVPAELREMTSGGWDYPYNLLVAVPISIVLIPIAMAVGRWRAAHMGPGPFSKPPLGIGDRGREE